MWPIRNLASQTFGEKLLYDDYWPKDVGLLRCRRNWVHRNAISRITDKLRLKYEIVLRFVESVLTYVVATKEGLK